MIGHANSVVLWDVRPKVSQAGRQRVLRERRKNVHAGLVGTLGAAVDPVWAIWDHLGRTITYNPYKYAGFVYKASEEPYTGSTWARLDGRTVEVA